MEFVWYLLRNSTGVDRNYRYPRYIAPFKFFGRKRYQEQHELFLEECTFNKNDQGAIYIINLPP